ncbi:Uncharacterized protein Rs2_14717 [Raphanus sativus]|uniref:Uncharacterized protein LOC108852673 n=1 Tax=Raphanus sativus TaxID=3726 RepID=A0A6J0NAC3_RAPSA|nr:uncharacterized protein LOC108852673 [Raphanus sativus]KAJ4900766.1 Uncharacterized protein Rs2_14717 [Raphanus sativus]
MSNSTSHVSPMPLSQHFSDYGFDPQIDYFQVLEEARKHKKETSLKSPIDSVHQFKLQKPISKDDLIRTALHNNKNKKHRWFFSKNALLFFNWRKWRRPGSHYAGEGDVEMELDDVHIARARNFRASSVGPGSISGPVYVTESWSGSSTPYRTIRPSSLTTTPAAIPYMSLRELNMERQQRSSASSSRSGPIYLVT